MNDDQLSSVTATLNSALGNAISSSTAPISSNLTNVTTTDYNFNGYSSVNNVYTPSWVYNTTSGAPLFSVEIQNTLNIMPLVLKVNSVKQVGNNLEIKYSKYSHKNYSKFLPDYGTILMANSETYAIYSKGDYYYWEDCLQVQVEDIKSAKSIIKKGCLFTTINNFDEHITNEEVTSFLADYDNYCRYAHIYLESLLSNNSTYKTKAAKVEIHNQLETYLR